MRVLIVDYVIHYLCIVVFFTCEVLLFKVVFDDLEREDKVSSDLIHAFDGDELWGVGILIKLIDLRFHVVAKLAGKGGTGGKQEFRVWPWILILSRIIKSFFNLHHVLMLNVLFLPPSV
jgi:hypothetical protein